MRDESGAVSLKTSDFHYDLPEELIASHPLPDRAASRMLVVHRASQRLEHRKFSEIGEYLGRDDLLVLNDTRVIPARVFSDDGKIELLCLEPLGPCEWLCLVKPGKKMRVGHRVTVGGIVGEVVAMHDDGNRVVRWQAEVDLAQHGHLALPHYMGRGAEQEDRERYQTVYAREEGAIAAPTAGLHFTPELLCQLDHAFLTLHVGVGTFRPVSVEDPADHVMHSERYRIGQETVRRVNAAGRVVAVGTTVTRVLEHLAREQPEVAAERISPGMHQGSTDIFIRPPYAFRAVDALLTNFHLPESTLMMLVSALAGREFMLEAYREAVAERYRFYSYGDCMLIL